MKVIYNKVIPFKGFKAISLFGFIFARKELNEVDVNHERIHAVQWREITFLGACVVFILMLSGVNPLWLIASPLFYYLLYVVEWAIRLPKGNAYRNVSFEREAFAFEGDFDYLEARKPFAWVKYLKPVITS